MPHTAYSTEVLHLISPRALCDQFLAQQGTTSELADLGHAALASRIFRCAAARVGRPHGAPWPWRCRSAGCMRCLHRSARRWTAGITAWADGHGGNSASTMALASELTSPTMHAIRLRRALRDLRDREARRDPRWGSVAFAGLCDLLGATIAIVHPELRFGAVMAGLTRRWPKASFSSRSPTEWPPLHATSDMLVELAIRRRGIEPIRVVVAAQRSDHRASKADHGLMEPMPMIFGAPSPW